MRDDPDVRKAVEAVRELEALTESGPWLYLRRRFGEYPKLVADRIAKRLLKGEDIDQRELDFSRGYAVAIMDLLDAPWRAEQELEKAAERAYGRLQRQEEESLEEPPNL